MTTKQTTQGPRNPQDITWHVPPVNQGQMIEVGYGVEDEYAWERTVDRSDRSIAYRCLGEVEDDWQPWNRVPPQAAERNPYGCDPLGHQTWMEETQRSCPDCGLDITDTSGR